MRVVSLVPSSTETLLALGVDVLACTKFCEQPDLPHVGGTKNPDIAAIAALAPDLVVLDREENRLQDADALSAHGLELFVSDVRSVDDAVAFVTELATRFDCDVPADFGLPPSIDGAPRTAFVPIWRRPWMSINAVTYGGSLLAHIGIELSTATCSDTYPTVDLATITADTVPDLVIVPSEPYEFSDGHLDELREAIPTVEIVRIDGQDLFWWGARTPAAVRRLAKALDAEITEDVLPPTPGRPIRS